MKMLITLLALFLVTGCATEYGDSGLTGGLEITRIDDNTLRISGEGNRYTTLETIADYVYLKAAEETLRLGYSYFQVLAESNRLDPESITTAAISTGSTSSSSEIKDGIIIYSYSMDEDQTMGQTFTVDRPSSRIVIRLYHETTSDNPAANIYSAQEILAELGPKYLK